MKFINDLGINSDSSIATKLSDTVNIKGNILNKVGTANSVSSIISWLGCMKILLSTKKLDPNPINISLVTYPKNIENIANIIKGILINISPSCACL